MKKKTKKQNTSTVISKGSPNYVKDIQEPYPVLNISSTGRVLKLSFDTYLKSINMNDRLEKKSRTEKSNKRKETLNTYMSQFGCTLAKKSPQSIPVCEMYYPFFFFYLLSLLNFSTDFLNFAEALFAYQT